VNCDTDGALIAVSQNGVLLGKGIATGGSVVISFQALVSTEPLAVVGTKQNYVSYRGPVQVGNGPLGIDELSAAVNMYPNPANDEVKISVSGNMLETAELVTITGQTVGTFAGSNGQLTIDLSAVAAGSYLVRLVTPNGVAVKRLEVVK
jgi:hypothetical protein